MYLYVRSPRPFLFIFTSLGVVAKVDAGHDLGRLRRSSPSFEIECALDSLHGEKSLPLIAGRFNGFAEIFGTTITSPPPNPTPHLPPSPV